MRSARNGFILIVICLTFLTCEHQPATTSHMDATAPPSSSAAARVMKELAPVPSEPPRIDCATLGISEFEVAVTFTGLMMIVPDGLDVHKPLAVMKAEDHRPVPWTVLIPNARRVDPGLQLPADAPGHIHPHTPFLGADPQYVCEESTATLRDTWCPMYSYFELDGVDVQWDTSASALSGAPQYSMGYSGDGVCPTDADKDSLHWVPSLSAVGFADHEFAPAYVDANPASKLIAGRTRIEGGTFSACVTSTARMNFRVRRGDTPGPVTQALAEETHYTFRGRGKTFTIQLQPFGGGPARTVVLAPVNGRIELTVGNVPNDFIPPTGELGDVEAADAHFGVYFRFLQNVKRRIIPHQIPPACDFEPCDRFISRPCPVPAGGMPSPEGGNCGKVKP